MATSKTRTRMISDYPRTGLIYPSDYGVLGDDSVETTAITAFIDAWKNSDELQARVPNGKYKTAASIQLNNPRGDMLGLGHPIFRYSGAAAERVFSISDPAQFRYGLAIRGVGFDGGANGRGTLFVDKQAQYILEDIEIWGAAAGWPAVEIKQAVLGHIRNLSISPQRLPAFEFTSIPQNGLVLGEGTAQNTATIAHTFENLIIEHVSSGGLIAVNALDCYYHGGTIEGCGGIGADFRVGSDDHYMVKVFFEINNTVLGVPGVGPDVLIASRSVNLKQCTLASAVGAVIAATAKNTVFEGCRIRKMQNAGTNTRFVDCSFIEDDWIDTGVGTKRINCYNESLGTWYADIT